MLVDGAVTALMLATTARSLPYMLTEQPALLPLKLVLVLPLLWRRRAPWVVFGAIAAVTLVQWSFGPLPMYENAALLVALYTVAAHRPWRPALLAGGVVELGNLLACLRWAPPQEFLHGFVSLSAMTLAAAVVGANIRIRRAHLASLEDRAARLERERDQQSRLAVAGERARISREMHDIVTHNLSVMVALADGAVYAQRRDPDQAATAMRQISGTGRQALTDMRRFLGVLRDDEPDALRHPMPGLTELEALAEQVRTAGLPVRLEVTGDVAPLPPAAQLTVYRLVQEALTNTIKHTPDGTSAEVRVRCTYGAIGVTVTDDGPPVPGSLPERSSGHGIHGMRERAAVYGGELEAGPAGPRGGWRVAARLDVTGVRV
jgi:signal transduction histidine kinase